jgi:hypothetical protein
MTVIVPTDWTSIMTAVGTVAVAVVAVAVALFAEWRARISVTSEREYAAGVLADERKAADDRLERQLAHSDAQLAEERKAADERLRVQLEHSDAQVREERQAALDAERVAEAWSVEILAAQVGPEKGITTKPGQPIGRPMALVTNNGRFTITRVEAYFCPDGQSTTPASITEQMKFTPGDHPYVSDITGSIGDVFRGVLAPGEAMRFLGDTRLDRDLRATYPIIRWTDHWNQRWEYKQGQVNRVGESDQWLP